MGLFDWLKQKKPKPQNIKYAFTQTGTIPIFSSNNDNILDDDTVVQCIGAIAREMKKLNPKHVRANGETKVVVNDSINKLLKRPNRNMTTSDFIEKCIWFLFLRDNCFIYPVYQIKTDENGYKKREYSAMYVLNPTLTEFYEDDDGNILDVKFTFANGTYLYENYQKIIHLKRNYGLNDFYGGDKSGEPNNEALIKTIKISDSMLEGINKGMAASYNVIGAMKYNDYMDDGNMEKNLQAFNEMLEKNKSGVIGLDLKGEFIPVTRDVKLVDQETIDFLDLKKRRNFGVPAEILDGSATADIKKAFYDNTLETLVVSFNQAFTNCFFTDGEIARGNEIIFYYNIMETFSNEEKLEHGKEMMDRGAMYINEFRELLGYPPMEDGNKTKPSLNYVDGDIANEYQKGKAGLLHKSTTTTDGTTEAEVDEDDS